MSEDEEVLAAYHRAVGREEARSGVSWPLVRASCVQGDGTITDTNRYEPSVVATWKRDKLGRVRIALK